MTSFMTNPFQDTPENQRGSANAHRNGEELVSDIRELRPRVVDDAVNTVAVILLADMSSKEKAARTQQLIAAQREYDNAPLAQVVNIASRRQQPEAESTITANATQVKETNYEKAVEPIRASWADDLTAEDSTADARRKINDLFEDAA